VEAFFCRLPRIVFHTWVFIYSGLGWVQAFGIIFCLRTGGCCFIKRSWFFVYAVLLPAPGKHCWKIYLFLFSVADSFLSMRNRNEAANLQI